MSEIRNKIEGLLNHYYSPKDKTPDAETEKAKVSGKASEKGSSAAQKAKRLGAIFSRATKSPEEKETVLMVAKVGRFGKRKEQLVERVPSNKFMAWIRGEKKDIEQIAQFCQKFGAGAKSYFFSKALESAGKGKLAGPFQKEAREAIYDAIRIGNSKDVAAFLENLTAGDLQQTHTIEGSSPLEWALLQNKPEIAHAIFEKMETYSGRDAGTIRWLTDELTKSIAGEGNPTQVFKLLKKIPLTIITCLSEDEQKTIAKMLVAHKKKELLLDVIPYLSDDCVRATMMPLQEKASLHGEEVTLRIAQKLSKELGEKDIESIQGIIERKAGELLRGETDKRVVKDLVSLSLSNKTISDNLSEDCVKSLIRLHLKTSGDSKDLYRLLLLLRNEKWVNMTKFVTYLESEKETGGSSDLLKLFNSLDDLTTFCLGKAESPALFAELVASIPSKMLKNEKIKKAFATAMLYVSIWRMDKTKDVLSQQIENIVREIQAKA